MDNLRACLVLSGILFHSLLFLTPFTLLHDWEVRNPITKPIYYFISLLIFSNYMPLFYILSGYFSKLIFDNYGTWVFIKHRFYRIGLPFFICFALLSLYNTGSFFAHYYVRPPISPYIFFTFIGPLWFIYYLLYYYLIILFLQYISVKFFKNTDFSLKISSFLLACIGFLSLLWNNSIFILPSLYLSISKSGFIIYFTFFLFGWILATSKSINNPVNKDRVSNLKNWYWLLLLLGLGIIFPLFAWLSTSNLTAKTTPLKIIAMLISIINSWFLSLGLLGMFYRFFDVYSKTLRYFAAASYWFYLIQVPIISILQLYFISFTMPLVFKLLNVYIFSIVIMAITYTLCVRKTFIGVLLNGQRAN